MKTYTMNDLNTLAVNRAGAELRNALNNTAANANAVREAHEAYVNACNAYCEATGANIWDVYRASQALAGYTIPHCTNCEDNPAAEGDELCHPCARLRDTQPVRQENDFWANRGGCSYRADDLDRAVYAKMERSAIRQRFAALAGAFLLSLSIGSALASDYTPTAPIGCAITHYWEQDDMSAIAVCAGGYLVTKQDGPVDDWDDIPFAVSTTYLTDDEGNVHAWPVWD